MDSAIIPRMSRMDAGPLYMMCAKGVDDLNYVRGLTKALK
jgi:hypothetical protein